MGTTGFGSDARFDGPPPSAWRVLVPGGAQWAWGQRERGAVLFGSFSASLVTAAFAWGRPVSLALVAFAFAAHLVSLVDVVRQATFPPPNRWAPWFTALTWLALGLYVPALTAAAQLAWAGSRPGAGGEGYLVNCWAFRLVEPGQGDWVWFQATPWGDPRLGRVVAGANQEVDWRANRLTVDGHAFDLPYPSHSTWPPHSLSYRVPEGNVLINPGGERAALDGLAIVEHDRIIGRAWAQFYPVLDRRLLD